MTNRSVLSRCALDGVIDRVRTINESGFLTEGANVAEFENLFSLWSGLESIAYNSAGTGLFALARCYDVYKCIIPNNTFFATGAMLQEAGATIRLCDVDPYTLNVRLRDIQLVYDNEVTKPDCLVLPHIGGIVNPEYEAIVAWCRSNNMIVLEDCAHATGAKCPRTGLIAGSLGDGGVYSFYPTKALPIGEGGMVVFDKKHTEAIEFCKRFRNYGKYKVHDVIQYTYGFNFRMDEWTAAVGCEQMMNLDIIMRGRANDAARLRGLGIKPVLESSNWYKYVVDKNKLPTSIKKFTGHIYTITDQLAQSMQLGGDFPHCNYISDNYVCLPVGCNMYLSMTDKEIVEYLESE